MPASVQNALPGRLSLSATPGIATTPGTTQQAGVVQAPGTAQVPPAATLDVVRRAVRSVIEQTPALARDPALARELARKMVRVSMTAAELIETERALDREIDAESQARHAQAGHSEAAPASRGHSEVALAHFQAAPRSSASAPLSLPPVAQAQVTAASSKSRSLPLAQAQAAGEQDFGAAADKGTEALTRTRAAIDFPSFVTSLITGVFQAVTTSNLEQLQAISELLEAIDTSADSFADQHIDKGQAAAWLAQRFDTLEVSDDRRSVRVRKDQEMPDAGTLQAALGASDRDVAAIDESELSSLVTLAQRKLGRDRQGMLSTMVLMGLNRVVVDQGYLEAGMHLQVDTRSIAEQASAARKELGMSAAASGSFAAGAWGASASMTATASYVRSDQSFNREDMALQARLRSRVQLKFHTEPLHLSEAARTQAAQIAQSSGLGKKVDPVTSLTGTAVTRNTKQEVDLKPSLEQAKAPSLPQK